MSFFYHSFHYYSQYFLKRKINYFFLTVSLRSLALGIVLIFEPIYIYLFFGKSLWLTLIYFGAIYGIYSLLAVFSGRAIEKFGTKKLILISHFLFLAYYICLYLLYQYPYLAALAIILKGLGISAFWPAFHVDFVRFSRQDHLGRNVGWLNVMLLIPAVIGPLIGGAILNSFNYAVLFAVCLVILLISFVPLSFAKESREVYVDSYHNAFKRIFDKENLRLDLAFASNGMELAINSYLWPLFLIILSIKYLDIGGIASISLAIGVIFSLYLGKISDSKRKVKTLNWGAFLTSTAWIFKFFVRTPLNALLAQSYYRLSRTAAAIPFKTIFYQEAAKRKTEADEFIIYREIIMNMSKFFLLMFLAILFFVFPQVNIGFLLASLISLGLILLGKEQTKAASQVNSNLSN